MSQHNPPVEDISWQDTYADVAQLREQVAYYFDQISERLNERVQTHTEVVIEADSETEEVRLICKQDEDAPMLAKASKRHGVSERVAPLEPVLDVFVDAVQSAGRRLELRGSARESRSRNRLVTVAPLEPNPESSEQD